MSLRAFCTCRGERRDYRWEPATGRCCATPYRGFGAAARGHGSLKAQWLTSAQLILVTAFLLPSTDTEQHIWGENMIIVGCQESSWVRGFIVRVGGGTPAALLGHGGGLRVGIYNVTGCSGARPWIITSPCLLCLLQLFLSVFQSTVITKRTGAESLQAKIVHFNFDVVPVCLLVKSKLFYWMPLTQQEALQGSNTWIKCLTNNTHSAPFCWQNPSLTWKKGSCRLWLKKELFWSQRYRISHCFLKKNEAKTWRNWQVNSHNLTVLKTFPASSKTPPSCQNHKYSVQCRKKKLQLQVTQISFLFFVLENYKFS